MGRYDTEDLDLLLSDVKRLLEDTPPASGVRQAQEGENGRYAAGAGQNRQDGFDWAAQNFVDEDVGDYEAPARKPTQAERAAGVRRTAAPAAERPVARTVAEPTAPKKKKKKWPVVLLILLALLAAGALLLAARQPVGDGKSLGDRKPGVSTILLAGTDGDGTRTDTMMLMCLDSRSGQVNLVSLPRDTLVPGGYAVPKLNSAYGFAGKGKAGMDELMTRVTEILGFAPDGYLLVDLDGFVKLVDLMGGVNFDVPVDMHYSDPAQDLSIDLTAGMQKLNGQQAMGLVRFRSGYARADLARVEVQRDFVAAAAEQWASVKNVFRIPAALAWYKSNVTTDLSAGNLTWIGLTLMRADLGKAETQTLPGAARMISGGSYYCLDAGAVAELVNRLVNPYQQTVQAADLVIRGG